MGLTRHYENQAWLWDLKEETQPSLSAMKRELYPPIEDLEREHDAILRDVRNAEKQYEYEQAVHWAWRKREKAMEYLVDAGEIVKVQGASALDAAHLALAAVGDRAKFPIEVHTSATGEKSIFVREAEDLVSDPAPPPPKKSPVRVLRDVRKKARA